MATASNLSDKIRLLHVDDEPDNLMISKIILQKTDPNLQITHANNAQEAIQLLLKEDYDCILSDYKMPGMNGIEFAEKVKSMIDTPFILYTGQGSEEVAERAYEVGVDSYIRKEMHPAHYRVLVERIRSLVEKYWAEHLSRNVLSESRDGIVIVQGTKFVYANQAQADLLGVNDPEMLIGRDIKDDLFESDFVLERALDRQAGKVAPSRYVYRIITESGVVRDIETSSSVIEYRGSPATLAINRDVTEERELLHDLGERVKELDCLYKVNQLLGDQEISQDEVMTDVVELIPPGWQYPEITCARITIKEKNFTSENYKETEWSQTSNIVVNDNPVGSIEVFYLEEMPVSDEGPFLKEERALITSISDNIGVYLEKRQGTEELEESIRLNQLLIDQMPCVAMLLKPSTREIVASNQAARDVGAIPGEHCFATFGQRDDPCPFCLAGKVWEGLGEQHLVVDALNVVWDAYWVPISDDLFMHYAFDITEQHRIEETLRESEEKYRSFLEFSRDAVSVNIGSKIVYVNPRFTEMLGYSMQELTNMTVLDVTAPEYWEMVEERTRRRQAGEIVTPQYELELLKKDGSRVPVEFNVALIEYEGKPASLTFIRDVSERKKTENELRESESRSIMFRESAIDGFIMYNAGMILVEANDSWLQQAGLERDDVIGKHALDIFPKLKETGRYDDYLKVLETGEPATYTSVLASIGQDLVLDISAFKVEDNLGILTKDVSDQVNYRNRLETLHKHAASMSSVVSIDEMAVITQKALISILGVNRGSLGLVMGSVLNHKYRWGIDSPDEFRMPLDGSGITVEVANSGETFRTGNIHETMLYVDGVGDPVTFSELAVPVKVSDKVVAVINIESETRDAFSEDDQRLVETLASHIASVFERIDYSNILRKIQSENEIRLLEGYQRFSSMVRHDLRTPLMNTMNAVDLIKQEPKMSVQLFEIIDRNLSNANQIMEDWRQKTLTRQINRTPVHIKELVSESTSALLLPDNISLNIEIEEELVADLDHSSMIRVITNLVKNALEAMSEGGVLSVEAFDVDGELSVVVSDTGVGMSDEVLGNVFTPFYTTKETGTGLGLAYCRQAVEAHGGSITVDSVEGEGTSFTINIPVIMN